MLALSMALHCAVRLKRPAQIVSLEMSHSELSTRILAAETGIATERFRRGLTKEEHQKVLAEGANREPREAPLFLGGDVLRSGGPDPSWTPAGIRRGCTEILRQHEKLDLLMVDYLSLMRTTRPLGITPDRDQELAQVVADLTALAAEMNTALVIVEQLTRATERREGHRPRLTDLTNREALLEHADAVILLYRDRYYAPPQRYVPAQGPNAHPPAPEPAELHVARTAHGETGVADVQVDLTSCQLSWR